MQGTKLLKACPNVGASSTAANENKVDTMRDLARQGKGLPQMMAAPPRASSATQQASAGTADVRRAPVSKSTRQAHASLDVRRTATHRYTNNSPHDTGKSLTLDSRRSDHRYMNNGAKDGTTGTNSNAAAAKHTYEDWPGPAKGKGKGKDRVKVAGTVKGRSNMNTNTRGNTRQAAGGQGTNGASNHVVVVTAAPPAHKYQNYPANQPGDGEGPVVAPSDSTQPRARASSNDTETSNRHEDYKSEDEESEGDYQSLHHVQAAVGAGSVNGSESLADLATESPPPQRPPAKHTIQPDRSSPPPLEFEDSQPPPLAFDGDAVESAGSDGHADGDGSGEAYYDAGALADDDINDEGSGGQGAGSVQGMFPELGHYCCGSGSFFLALHTSLSCAAMLV